MKRFKLFDHVSESPTRPHKDESSRAFDVRDLTRGPFGQSQKVRSEGLDEKLRKAYFWIVNHAIISPYYDIEYNDAPPRVLHFGDSQSPLSLPSDQSYSSFILLPLLTFAARRKCLFIGGPGRGKTASALLMGVLSGYSPKTVKRNMLHGHPQMTTADLLGNPLPADLMNAEQESDIRIAWRDWLSMRVKIVDEYNRIPTRTQSSLLTVLGDNYAEMFNQIYECPPSAWFLTANDDEGGGTYQVIDALKDRIDVAVQALAFNPRFLEDLLLRVEEGLDPAELLPQSLVFSEQEQDELEAQIKSVVVPESVRRRLEFFASQFEFSEYSGHQFEYKSKDTSRLAGIPRHEISLLEDGRDRLAEINCQTRNGLSVRSLMSLLVYAKAIAFFRGNQTVDLNDLRQVLPFVLHIRLIPDHDAPFFQQTDNATYRSDRIGWLRHLFDLSCTEFERQGRETSDPIAELKRSLELGLSDVSLKECRVRLQKIETELDRLSHTAKLNAGIYDDILALKYMHQRYTNYLNWLLSSH